MPYAIYVKIKGNKRFIRYGFGKNKGRYTYENREIAQRIGKGILNSTNSITDFKVVWIKK